jgi:hypothetical protein
VSRHRASRPTGTASYDADLHRLRAEILLDMDADAAPEAKALLAELA